MLVLFVVVACFYIAVTTSKFSTLKTVGLDITQRLYATIV